MGASVLSIKAGKTAFELIQSQGLRADDVSSVFAASGAAKWLTISALDAAIFGEWLVTARQPVHLFGTSIGAWKLAVAAQDEPQLGLAQFAQAYCNQRYAKTITHSDIQTETDKIIAALFSQEKIQQILNNPRFYFHCGAVVCRNLLASESKPALAFALTQANILNLVGRKHLRHLLKRVVFNDPRQPAPINPQDGIPTQNVSLTTENFVRAITASGSIPYMMAGVDSIDANTPGMYRDGGLIDYHPLPSNFWQTDRLILYPHFYSQITPGWFDKTLSWRKARPTQLDNVVVVSPSPEFIASLPGGRIPDRKDFLHFRGDNDSRIRQWQYCIDRGKELAQSFLQSINSSTLRDLVQPL